MIRHIGTTRTSATTSATSTNMNISYRYHTKLFKGKGHDIKTLLSNHYTNVNAKVNVNANPYANAAFPKGITTTISSMSLRSIGSSCSLQAQIDVYCNQQIMNIILLLPFQKIKDQPVSSSNQGDKDEVECDIKSQMMLACSTSTSSAVVRDGVHSIIAKITNAIVNRASKLWELCMVLLRTSEIGIRFSPLILLAPAAILASKSNNNSFNNNSSNKNDASILSNIAWKYTLYTIQKLGPAFIKISQWAATRRDIFPCNVCDKLSELNDATFLHPWEHTHGVLANRLGEDYGDWLEVKEEDVIGSGSVAQVYIGFWTDKQLKDEENDRGNTSNTTSNSNTTTSNTTSNSNKKKTKGRRRVAIKILHPDIQHYVERDLLLMKRAANIIGEFFVCHNLIHSI